MTEIKSSIGRIRRTATGADSFPQKTFVVDDPIFDNMPKDLPPPVRETKPERINPQHKRGLEALLGIARLTKETTVDGIVFKLQSLKTKEAKMLTEIAAKYSQIENSGYTMLFEIRTFALACSVAEVDGVSFSEIIGSDDIEEKMAVVEEFDENLATVLYNTYEEMTKEGRELYKTDSAKELISDIKK